jgi:dTDP-4-dehydrorhamnose reductase
MNDELPLSGKRIAIFGAAGMLGLDTVPVFRAAGADVIAFTRDECDVADQTQCQAAFTSVRPDIAVNCTAYTDVNGAESYRDEAFLINETAAANLARAAKESGAKFTHVSTDYVFDGEKDGLYETSDPVNPLNIYGASKLAGEKAIEKIGGQWLIARTSWLYGPGGKNFVTTMLHRARDSGALRVVNDQFGAPTYTVDLAQTLVKLCGANAIGITHCTSSGSCTWFDFAREIFKLAGIEGIRVEPVPASAFPSPARRPRNSRMSSASLAHWGVQPLPSWQDGLSRYLKRITDIG